MKHLSYGLCAFRGWPQFFWDRELSPKRKIAIHINGSRAGVAT
jgi:hypothetical protein